jgi:threonine aldolase
MPADDSQPIDLRSDAITLPTDAMWDAMRSADLGWASAGEDPALQELEDEGARLTGKEAALFVLTGGMANLVALMTHTTRGDQILLESSSHILWCEEWSFAHICGLVHRAVEGIRGQIRPADVSGMALDSLYRHRPRTSLLCLENTDNTFGEAVGADYVTEVASAAHALDISVHLDGARLLNACVALDVAADEVLAGVDSSVLSLNKGLSAPTGALLVGSADFVRDARANLRRLGGASYHQAGMYAAAGLVALRDMIPQLAEDNRRAALLARLLAGIPGLAVDVGATPTNMVIVRLGPELVAAQEFIDRLALRGVRGYTSRESSVRFVTHRHIDDGDIETAAAEIASVVRTCWNADA